MSDDGLVVYEVGGKKRAPPPAPRRFRVGSIHCADIVAFDPRVINSEGCDGNRRCPGAEDGKRRKRWYKKAGKAKNK